jgi:hypothetical protein
VPYVVFQASRDRNPAAQRADFIAALAQSALPGADLVEVGHDHGVVEPVARHPGQFGDDDVVDVSLGADSGEHALELDPFGHLRRAAARLDVLVDDGQAELIRLALDDRAISRLDTVESRRVVVRKKGRCGYFLFQCVIEGARVCARNNTSLQSPVM